MTNIILLSVKDYVKDLTREINQAQKRVFIMTCVISDESSTHELFAAVGKAAQRGLETNIAADAFTFSRFGGYFSPFKRRKARSKAAAKMAQNFRRTGATFRWLGGGFKFNPFAGVTHIKWCLVDDTVYCFGGVNLFQEGIEYTDYMFKSSNPELASVLAREQTEVIKADMSFVAYDGFYQKVPQGFVYIDTGDRGNSPIYNSACELTEKAKSVTFVSQYCPGGRLTGLLKQKRANIYFNQPQNTSFYTRIFISFAMWRYNMQTLYKKKKYLHAKFMLFEMPDGRKIALTGSHNFSYTGVNFGTREVALESSDPYIYKQLEDFFHKNIV